MSDEHKRVFVNGEEATPIKKTKVKPETRWQTLVRQKQKEEKAKSEQSS